MAGSGMVQRSISCYAPVDGYQQTLCAKRTYSSGDKTKLPDYIELPRDVSGLSYIFRIRTEYDDEGNAESAYYGKMLAAVQVNWNKTVRFGYWLNTDPTSRSLESIYLVEAEKGAREH